MSAARVAEHDVCASCRGRWWKCSGSRRWAASQFVWGLEDEGGFWVPTVAEPDYGHGLEIIQALADGWGVDGDDSGRIVWARFDWPDS